LNLGKEGEYESYKRIVRIEAAILSEQPVFATELTEDAIGTSETILGPIQSDGPQVQTEGLAFYPGRPVQSAAPPPS
jgi:hypothetical protein